jgi:hypothetical protein
LKNEKAMFELMDKTGIDFINQVEDGKKENSFLNSEDFKYFKSSNKNFFYIEKIVKEKVTVKGLGFGNYLTNLYSNRYHSLNFIFISLIATAIIFTILKKRL